MLTITMSILPIFLVIALGYLGARRGLFPEGFVGPANRLAFYLAIPALIFRAVATAPAAESWQPLPALLVMAAMVIIWLAALPLTSLANPKEGEQGGIKGSWVQCSTHGNIGIMGLAVILYALGEEGIRTAGLIATCVIIMQNVLSVICLTLYGSGSGGLRPLVKEVALNPIIIATCAGLAVSLGGIALPDFLARTFKILGNMGPPLALLIIGAVLSKGGGSASASSLSLMQFIKLAAMPALGWALLSAFGVAGMALAVAVILLASPSATVCVVMASEMGGDVKLSSKAVTISSALSAPAYVFWLWLLTG